MNKEIRKQAFVTAVLIGVVAISARGETGINFESEPVGPYNILSTASEYSAQAEGQSYWTTNANATLNIEQLATTFYFASLPAFYDAWTRTLSIITPIGETVSRHVLSTKAPVAVEESLCFDSMVKFAIAERGIIFQKINGSKISVWAQENYDGGTNLIVCAGFLDAAQPNGVKSYLYRCRLMNNTSVDWTAWHRLTIKMSPTIYAEGYPITPGFVVFIDNTTVISIDHDAYRTGIDAEKLTSMHYAYYTDCCLFPSADQSNSASTQISAVDFDGQGHVDNIRFSTEMPSYAVDFNCFSLMLDSNVASVKYAIGGNTNTITQTKTFYPTEIPLNIELVEIEYAPTYVSNSISLSVNVSANGKMLTVGDVTDRQYAQITSKKGVATVNGKAFGSLYEVSEYVEDNGLIADLVLLQDTVDTLSFWRGTNTIDLAGHSITSPVNDIALYLADSGRDNEISKLIVRDTSENQTGRLVATGEYGLSFGMTSGIICIESGTFDGPVEGLDNAEAGSSITGGRFRATDNEQEVIESLLPVGYEIIERDGYYVVQPITP